MNDATRVLHADFDAMIAYVPRLVGAFFILLVGAGLAWLVGKIVAGVLARVGFDRLAERTGLIDDLARVGVRTRPSLLLGRLTFFIVVISAAAQAIDTLELAPISDALRHLLTYVPHIVVAVLLLLFGVVAADLVARGVSAAMSRAGILHSGPTTMILRTTIIVLTLLMALEQLTIESRFLLDVLLVILAGGALAAGIAAGWGSRTFAENVIAAHYVERHLKVGDRITIGTMTGTVDALDVASTSLRTPDGARLIVPNSVLAKEAIEVGNVTAPPSPDDASSA